MSLSDIQNRLYKKDADKNLGHHDESQYDPSVAAVPTPMPDAPADLWLEKQKGLAPEQKKAAKTGLYIIGGIVAVLLIMVSVYMIMATAFSEERVIVEVAGPKEIKSGRLVSYEISYHNNNRSSLENVELKLNYPESFKPEDNASFMAESPTSGTYKLGSITKQGQGKITFHGRVYSPKGALMFLKAELKYNPSSLTSQFVAQNQLGINVTTTPIDIEVMAPQHVAIGDEVNYVVSYKNVGQDDFENLKIKVDYPESFVYANAQPKVSESNNIWYIGRLSAGQESRITISGRLEGNRDEIKTVTAMIGTAESGAFVSYNDEHADTKMVAPPLTISQTVNGLDNLNINAGQLLRFHILYKNEGSTGLRDVIVKELLDSPVLDYKTMELDGGSFDESTKTITWKASDHPELKNLAPGQSGQISFTVQVKEIIPVDSGNDKNYVVSSIAKIDSPDVPTPINMNKIVSGNRMDMRLNSKLVVDVKGFYNDALIANSGPIPPKVGEETTYTLHWKILNVSNDVTGARVEAVLPTNASLTGKIYPEGAKVTHNERNNSIVWEIGSLAAGTGILTTAPEVAFQVKIKPSPEQVGRTAALLNISTITAHDEFTGDNLKADGPDKNTELREDAGIGYEVVN